MAKKQRRKQPGKPMRQAAQSAAPGQPTASARAVTAPATTEAPRKQRSVATWGEHAQRYDYVNRELKNIGIIAGSFLVILLVLSAIVG